MNQTISHIIQPQSGKAFAVKQNQFIKIVDINGHQTGDFFAVVDADRSEWFSAGVTIDYNGNIYLKEKDFLYSNRFNKLLQIEQDTVGTHDLVHPTCSQRMYESHYNVDRPHPSCHQNIHDGLAEFGIVYDRLTTVFNFFMNAKVQEDGQIIYRPPLPAPGRFIVLQALTDLIVAVTSCSVTQSAINNYSASPLKVEIYG